MHHYIIAPPKFLEISNNKEISAQFVVYSCAQKNVIESSKIFDKKKQKTNKRLKVTLKVVDNVVSKCLDTANYTEENLKEKF